VNCMANKPDAFFTLSGECSSIVLSTKPALDTDPTAAMHQRNLWSEERVQLGRSAIFFGLGSDAIGQPLSIFITRSDDLPIAARRLSGEFHSRGESVWLEYVDVMAFDSNGHHFYLPEGEYQVHLLSWDIDRARDNFEDEVQPDNVRHEMFFFLQHATKPH
jgi:hypothetical protein